MKLYLDIATSYYTESLTLIIGTGFSKWITNGKAPNWLELIVYCIDRIDPTLKDVFLVKDTGNGYISGDIPLTVVAQLLEIEAQKRNMILKDIACECIQSATIDSNIDKDKVNLFKSMFEDKKAINIITTNYDKIISEYIFQSSRIFTEGSVFSKVSSGIDIFHIHGIVTNPSSLVLTQNDYYNFQIKNNYFSRKLYTLIHENSIGILGYSLNDSDINFILNEANTQKMKNFHNGDIFYITKNEINSKLKDFYKLSFDIEVLENTTFEDFISKFNMQKHSANNMLESFSNIDSILAGKGTFEDEYLKIRDSFYQIIKHISMNGLSLSDGHIYTILLAVLQKKKEFCREYGAWEQYDHLSDWLIELLSIVDIKDIPQEGIKEVIIFSLNTCSRNQIWGHSWYAYRNWEKKWKNLLYNNQLFLKEIIVHEFTDSDPGEIKLLLEQTHDPHHI
ncbi:MAG: SIR2 family protein [Treponema sp.]|jgi:hypothetical protein|nr:SIR2 family protein [Treponema sp.]